MLILFLDYYIVQKRDGKRDAVGLISFGGFKIVFTLMTKAVVVQVKIPIIKIEEPTL